MEKTLKHPIVIMIIGSLITYFIIPQIKSKNDKIKEITEYKQRFYNLNEDINLNFYKIHRAFSNYKLEQKIDSSMKYMNSNSLKWKYYEEIKEHVNELEELWFKTNNLRTELYLFEFADTSKNFIIEENLKHLKAYYSEELVMVNKHLIKYLTSNESQSIESFDVVENRKKIIHYNKKRNEMVKWICYHLKT